MIKVIHVREVGYIKRDFSTSTDGHTTHYVYCGRPSAYGNPYFMAYEEQRATVIAQFKANTLPTMNLGALKEKAITGDLLLGCFCAPKPCHCDAIKQVLEEALAVEAEAAFP